MAKKEKSWWQPGWLTGEAIRALVRFIMGVFAISLFALGTRIVWKGGADSAALAGVAIGGGGFCLIFFFLTQFKKFKGFGIEAESWEREMEDAKRITDNLRNLAQVVAEPSVMVLMRTGRWSSGTSRREAHELVGRFEKLLTATDTSKEDIERAVTDYYRYTLFDMVAQLRKPLEELLDEKVKPFKDSMDSFGNPVTDLAGHNAACEAWQRATEKAVKAMQSFSLENLTAAGFGGVIEAMRGCDLLDQININEFLGAFKEEVADIQFLEEYKKLRRPEVWFDSEETE